MNIYCDLCANKDREETCRTCVEKISMTTDGDVYGLPSNYSCVYKPAPKELCQKVAEYCSNDVLATEAAFNKLFGHGLLVW